MKEIDRMASNMEGSIFKDANECMAPCQSNLMANIQPLLSNI